MPASNRMKQASRSLARSVQQSVQPEGRDQASQVKEVKAVLVNSAAAAAVGQQEDESSPSALPVTSVVVVAPNSITHRLEGKHRASRAACH